MNISPLSLNASDSGFLETRHFRDEEVAKVFSLPSSVLEQVSACNCDLDSDALLTALNSSENRNE